MMFDRGLQLGATGRYLGETDAAPTAARPTLEVLPNDRETEHRPLARQFAAQPGAIKPNWSYGWNLQRRVGRRIPERLFAAPSPPAPSASCCANCAPITRQVLDPDRARAELPGAAGPGGRHQSRRCTVPRPYDRLPADELPRRPLRRGAASTGRFDAEATRFCPSRPTCGGNRAWCMGQVSYPIVRPGYFVTPKLMLNAGPVRSRRPRHAPGQADQADAHAADLLVRQRHGVRARRVAVRQGHHADARAAPVLRVHAVREPGRVSRCSTRAARASITPSCFPRTATSAWTACPTPTS